MSKVGAGLGKSPNPALPQADIIQQKNPRMRAGLFSPHRSSNSKHELCYRCPHDSGDRDLACRDVDGVGSLCRPEPEVRPSLAGITIGTAAPRTSPRVDRNFQRRSASWRRWPKVAGARLPPPPPLIYPFSTAAVLPERAGCRDRFGAG